MSDKFDREASPWAHPVRWDELAHVFREWRAFAKHHRGFKEAAPQGGALPLPEPLPEFDRDARPEDLPPTGPNRLETPNEEDAPGGPEPLWESTSQAALFVSDLHVGDGTAGDDFLAGHLAVGPEGQVVGGSVAGRSKAPLFSCVLTFALQRLQRLGIEAPLDVVLNGDILDYLEMLGRGTCLAPMHFGLFGTLAAAREMGHSVVYLRGNHDHLPPPGPWNRAHAYANCVLRTYAEHGDRHDPMNWPPGNWNYGSMIVRLVRAALEVKEGGSLAGVDNVIGPFRRPGISPAMAMLLAGAVNDQATLAGALLTRTTPRYLDWLIVQGHAHVPLAIPGAYYNTGTWIQVLASGKAGEVLFEAPPFLLVYSDPRTGERVEEFYTLDLSSSSSPLVVQRDRAGVNALREVVGWYPV